MSFLDNIFKSLDKKEITGLTNELKAIYTYELFKQKNRNIILVTSNLHEASKYYTSISHHTKKVWFFPMDDFLTSEALAISPELKMNRLEALNNIIKEEKNIVVTNLMGYLRFLPPKKAYKSHHINLKINNEYNQQELIKKLYNLGYKRQTTINMTGEIAVRGFVIDIFPINTNNPIRLEFWSDTIENIKYFDINTQRTIKDINSITIYPNTEFLIDKDESNIPYREIYKYTQVESIKDYLNDPIVIFDNYQDIHLNYNLLLSEIKEYNISQKRNPTTKYMHELKDPKDFIIFETFNNLKTSNYQNYHTKEIENFKPTKEIITKKLKKYLKTNKRIIICLENRYQINKFLDLIEIKNKIYTNEKEIYPNQINLIKKSLQEGFETEEYIVITPKELFGKQNENNYKTKFKYGVKIKDITKLEIGDYVVHETYGIGKYLGIKTIPKNKIKKDYLVIEYRDHDKLYIPVENLNLITKYSGKEGIIPKLNKLGTKEWEKTKAKAKRRAENIAGELLELYAKRESQKGFAFDKDGPDQIQFEKQFEYKETIDQLRVIEEIKKDMESPKPMDRLLCGDVGYGKTEVAFRAIFKCILSNKQAAILCPTTILSHQHFKNAQKRFAEYPINIAIVNRFVTQKQLSETLEKLKTGHIDLLIGTHRLLSDDIIFKDLGLLVIDEEQRFGVKHKEKIKKYKNNIDVLTLSATPIPRTLQMSMTGIRSLSLIETPPAQRYPISTYVLAENNQIIKDAVYKEMARNGQTYILYNSVENIELKQKKLQQLMPDAHIAIAHGKMSKDKLEEVMMQFENKKYDVLLCTTIIETGIDIPTANTLIIIDADKFGLSQLYQIRGRIGRSTKIAYCYLMYNNKKVLSEIATKRLKVIKDFTELGSGFAIAMRDLSIRGAGDLLGSEQSGFIDNIGIDLFLEMLQESVEKLKGNQPKLSEENKNSLLEVEEYIPDSYVQEEELKIEIHTKVNEIDSPEKLIKVKEELEDRFGKISPEIEIYMHEKLFENKLQKLNIKKIKQTNNFIEIILPENLTAKIDGEKLFFEINNITRMFRMSLRKKELIITLDTVKLEKHFIYYLLQLIDKLETCQKNFNK